MGVPSELTTWTFSPDINITEGQVLEEIVQHVRQSIGPVAAFRKAVFVQQLPKTRSGKIPRAALSALVNGKPYKVHHPGCWGLRPQIFASISVASTELFKGFSGMNDIPEKHLVVPFCNDKGDLHSHSLCRNEDFAETPIN